MKNILSTILLVGIISAIGYYSLVDINERVDRLNGDMSINFVHSGPATKGYNTYQGSSDNIREFLNRQIDNGVKIKVVGFEKVVTGEYICLFVVE